MYKTVLVHVDADDPASADRIQVAAHIAGESHGSLIGVAARLSATIAVLASGGAGLAGGVIGADGGDLESTFAASRAEFTRVSAGIATTASWRTMADFPATALAAIAGAADLIVVGAQGPNLIGGTFVSVDVGDLVLRAGRPVLAVPQGVTRLDLGGAVVAWRNTREARRAVADALPMLGMASPVTLVHVPERENDQASLADAKAHLAAHGIAASIEVLEAGRDGAGRAIVDFAKRSQAGLLVTGAYGHARAREWAFGGVTRELTRQTAIPTLFSH